MKLFFSQVELNILLIFIAVGTIFIAVGIGDKYGAAEGWITFFILSGISAALRVLWGLREYLKSIDESLESIRQSNLVALERLPK